MFLGFHTKKTKSSQHEPSISPAMGSPHLKCFEFGFEFRHHLRQLRRRKGRAPRRRMVHGQFIAAQEIKGISGCPFCGDKRGVEFRHWRCARRRRWLQRDQRHHTFPFGSLAAQPDTATLQAGTWGALPGVLVDESVLAVGRRRNGYPAEINRAKRERSRGQDMPQQIQGNPGSLTAG